MASEIQLELPAPPAPPPAPPPAQPEQVSAGACPRCRQPLIDPDGLGWCKVCGYCRSLETERNNQLLQAPSGPTRGTILAGAAAQIPVWFWTLIGGVGALAVLALATGQLLPAGNGLPRALWTTVQIPVGLLFIFAAQLYAVVVIAPEDERLSFKDALVPTRLWALVAKRLPRLGGCVCLAVWGAALVLFALLFIGGLGHWFSYLPGAEKALPTAKNLRR